MLLQLVHPLNLDLHQGLQTALRESSFQEAAQWLLDQCRIHADVQTGTFPSQGPQVIIMNSTGPLGGVCVIANVDRRDLCVLGTGTQVAHIVNESQIRIFQLYLSQQPNPNRLARLKNNIYHRRHEGIDRDEAALRNVISIRRAAQWVDKGRSLLVAPMGGTFFHKKDWKPGVGALFNSIRDPNTQIVFVRLHGGRSAHLIRLMNPYWFRLFIRQERIRLQIEPPISLGEFKSEGASAEDTSALLKQRYIQTFGSL